MSSNFCFQYYGISYEGSERPCYKDLKTEKNWNMFIHSKRYNDLKFEFPVILLLKITQEVLRWGKGLYGGSTVFPLYSLLSTFNVTMRSYYKYVCYILADRKNELILKNDYEPLFLQISV